MHDSPSPNDSEMRRNSFINGTGQSNDTSPFNSKFTVLKFQSPQVQHSKFHNGLIGADNFANRGLFSNASNYSFAHSSSTSDIFSQASAAASSMNSFMNYQPFSQ